MRKYFIPLICCYFFGGVVIGNLFTWAAMDKGGNPSWVGYTGVACMVLTALIVMWHIRPRLTP